MRYLVVSGYSEPDRSDLALNQKQKKVTFMSLMALKPGQLTQHADWIFCLVRQMEVEKNKKV